ncbi:hypothetical protein FPV67DRAFT_1443910 [Lyophyllum atratum]|nr:hypothetical protein FPV67DRAFT_1443910 [Lyophyllum atratum]
MPCGSVHRIMVKLSFLGNVFGSQLSDLDSVQIETPPLSGDTLTSMLDTAPFQPSSYIQVQENTESSTEVDVPVIPMLTTLSLPGSVDTTLDMSRHGSTGHDNVLHSTLHPSLDASGTQTSPSNCFFSSSPEISEDTGTAAIRILNFPSPSVSLSPFMTAPPESPVIGLTTADSSAVEYAAAVVSSAWGGDISVHPAYPGINSLSAAMSNPRPVSHLELDSVQSERALLKSTVVTKIKKLSRHVKRFLTSRARGTTRTRQNNNDETSDKIDTAHERDSGLLRARDDVSSPTEARHFRDLPGEDSVVSTEGGHWSLPLPLPPGLASPPDARKALTAGTYTSASVSSFPASNSNDHTAPPMIRITSSSCSYRTHPARAPDEDNENRHAPEDQGRILEIQTRPKTLAEIKSKRRLSLSGLSHFSRPASQQSSSMVAVARSRPRPTSTIIFTTASSSSIADDGAAHTDRARHSSAAVPAEENDLRVPGFSTAVHEQRPSSSAARASTPNPVTNDHVAQKKRRRFSLSALSNLVNNSMRGNKPLPEVL